MNTNADKYQLLANTKESSNLTIKNGSIQSFQWKNILGVLADNELSFEHHGLKICQKKG